MSAAKASAAAGRGNNAPASAPDTVNVELTATQYVILAENQRKKAALAQQKALFSSVAAEKASLLNSLRKLQQESYEVTEALRQEVVAKDKQLEQLMAQLELERSQHAGQVQEAQRLAAQREAKLVSEAERHVADLDAHISELSRQLSDLAHFQAAKADMDAELEALRAENLLLKHSMAKQKEDMEREGAEATSRQKREYEQRIEELKRSQEEESEEKLDASVRRILAQNRRMAAELQLHLQATEALQKEVALLDSERIRLTRDLAVKAELEEGFARRGAKQAAAIKEAHSKIASLEASLAQLVEQSAKERREIAAAAQEQISEAKSDADALRKLVKLKTHELRRVRRLAQEVLLQRSDVETFLVAALHRVKGEIAKSAVQKSEVAKSEVGAQRGDGSFQRIEVWHRDDCVSAGSVGFSGRSSVEHLAVIPEGSGDVDASSSHQQQQPSGSPLSRGAGTSQGAGYSMRSSASPDARQPQVLPQGERFEIPTASSVDISDLSWADREKVLRLLFAKINNQAKQHQYSNLPPHSLDQGVPK